jgi:integrase
VKHPRSLPSCRLRLDELRHLRGDDVNLAHHRIRVHHSKTRAGRREIAMLPLLQRVLTIHRA